MLSKAEQAHNPAINSRLWPPSPFTIRSIRFLLFVFAFLISTSISRMDIYDQKEVEAGLVVTRCWNEPVFLISIFSSYLLLLLLTQETAAKSTKQGWEKSCQQETLRYFLLICFWGK